MDPASVTVNANQDEPVQVQVTNTFHLGSVLVTKQIDGPGADHGQGPFEVCSRAPARTPEPNATSRSRAAPCVR